jgi:GPH family glycoside/pentoside/hexuronide:cation symporter
MKNENINEQPKEKEVYENSKKIMASYGTTQFFGQWITGPFSFYVFFFFKQEIGLNVVLAMAGMIIYAIWNAVNDPLIGYIIERFHIGWEKRLGKRFPWILIGSIPWLFSYLLIYMVPFNWDPITDPSANLPVFIWYVLTIILFDTLFTIWNVSATAIYPDKFRGLNERRTAGGFGTIIGIMGIVASSIIPPFFITENIPETYRTAAWIGVGLGIIIFLLMIPGVFEDKKTRDLYEERRIKLEAEEHEVFLKTAKRIITDRRFMVKVIYFFGYQAAVALLSASAQFMVIFVIGGTTFDISIFMAAMLIGALGSLPIWLHFSKKINNNKRMSIIAGFVMVFTFLPVAFSVGYVFYFIALLLFGIGLGGQWFMDPPTMGDVLDDLAVRTGKMEQAIYYGYQTFFIRFGEAFKVIIIGIIHILTGFPEGVATYTELVNEVGAENIFLPLLGVRIHAAIIPAILVLITIFVFWKWYDLTPDKVKENKAKLLELGL